MNTKLFVAIAAGVLVLESRCTPATSQNIRALLQQSFLFRAADIYYPEGPPADPSQFQPQLTDAQVRMIEEETRREVADLVKYEQARGSVLAAYMGKPIDTSRRVQLRLVNSHAPVAQVEPDGDIVIDVSVLQAVFRTSLLSALLNYDVQVPDHGETRAFENMDQVKAYFAQVAAEREKRKARDENGVIKSFFSLKAQVAATQTHGIFGDAASVAREDTDREPALYLMRKLFDISTRVRGHYEGALTFLIAHELGHLALHHRPVTANTASECARLTADELEADRFAAFVLADMFRTPASRKYWQTNADESVVDFFQRTYALAEFNGKAVCDYPPVSARTDNAKRAVALAEKTPLQPEAAKLLEAHQY